jgi:uncharacterized LabA/DUF88 family protein
MNTSAQRVGVFVDVQNMYYSARALYEQKVDFGEILKAAVGDRQLIRAFAYVIRADKEDEQSFFDALEDRGYELRSKELLTFYGGNQKGDWDVGLSMDVVRLAPKLDAVVIVSGDGDFADLLNYVKSVGCRAEVMAFGSSASSALRETADILTDLSEDTRRFLIPKKRAAAPRPSGRPGVSAMRRSPAAQAEAQITPTGSGQPAQRTVPQQANQSVHQSSQPQATPPAQSPRPAQRPPSKTQPSRRAPRITT